MERTKNGKPAIAVDLDDVVFPCAEGLVAAYNEHYGTNFRPDIPQTTWLLLVALVLFAVADSLVAFLPFSHLIVGLGCLCWRIWCSVL